MQWIVACGSVSGGAYVSGMVILQGLFFSCKAYMVRTPGSVRSEVSPTSIANVIYSSRYSGSTSTFDRRIIPSADIGNFAHIAAC